MYIDLPDKRWMPDPERVKQQYEETGAQQQSTREHCLHRMTLCIHRRNSSLHISEGVSIRKILAMTGIESQPGPLAMSQRVIQKPAMSDHVPRSMQLCNLCHWYGTKRPLNTCPGCGTVGATSAASEDPFYENAQLAMGMQNTCSSQEAVCDTDEVRKPALRRKLCSTASSSNSGIKKVENETEMTHMSKRQRRKFLEGLSEEIMQEAEQCQTPIYMDVSSQGQSPHANTANATGEKIFNKGGKEISPIRNNLTSGIEELRKSKYQGYGGPNNIADVQSTPSSVMDDRRINDKQKIETNSQGTAGTEIKHDSEPKRSKPRSEPVSGELQDALVNKKQRTADEAGNQGGTQFCIVSDDDDTDGPKNNKVDKTQKKQKKSKHKPEEEGMTKNQRKQNRRQLKAIRKHEAGTLIKSICYDIASDYSEELPKESRDEEKGKEPETSVNGTPNCTTIIDPVVSVCRGPQTPRSLPQVGAVGGGTASAVATGRATVEVRPEEGAEMFDTAHHPPSSRHSSVDTEAGSNLGEAGFSLPVSVPAINAETVHTTLDIGGGYAEVDQTINNKKPKVSRGPPQQHFKHFKELCK